MAIVVDAPQGLQVSSGSELIAMKSVTAVGNALPLPLNGAAVLMVDNRSDAGILVQLMTAGQIASPYVEIVDPGTKRTFNYGLPMVEVILSNVTVKGLPQPFNDFLFPSIPAQQNLTDGFIVLAWTSGNLDVQDGQNDSSVTINNSFGTTLNVGLNQVGLGSGLAAANGITTFDVQLTQDINGLLIALENSANVSHIRVQGDQTGTPYYDQNAPFASLVASPVDSVHDTSVTISVTMPAAQTCQLYITGRRDSLLNAITNLSQPPSSQTVAGTVAVSGVAGTVGVGNAPGSVLSTSNSRVSIGTSTPNPGPVGHVVITTFAMAADFTALALATSDVNGRVQIRSHANPSLQYADFNPMPNFLYVICPLVDGADTQFDVVHTSGGAANAVVIATGLRNPIASVPTNFGNAPLIVQPASGSSQTVVPGTAAAKYLASATPAGVQNNLGAAQTKPTSIYGLSIAAEMSIVAAGAAPATDGIIAFGYQGVTSGVVILLAVLGVNIPAIAAAGTVKASNFDNIVFPFPLSMNALFPNDTQIQGMYQANFIVANSTFFALTS